MKSNGEDNNYNLLAPIYDLLGSVMYFGALRRAQGHFLADIPKGSRILFIGGGTGFLLNLLFQRCEPKEVWYVEKSGAMIRKSKKAVSHEYRNRINFLEGTQDDIPGEEKFDVVLSFFFFDQFRFMTLGKIFLKLNMHLKADGQWLWADFIPPQTWWQKIMMQVMLGFFSLTTRLGTDRVYDVPAIFRKRGLKLEKEAHYYGGFIRTVLLRKS